MGGVHVSINSVSYGAAVAMELLKPLRVRPDLAPMIGGSTLALVPPTFHLLGFLHREIDLSLQSLPERGKLKSYLRENQLP